MPHVRPYSTSSSPVHRGASTLRWLHSSALSMLVLFSVMFSATFAHAQFRTSVQGVVTDPTGAVIPGATLTLKNNSTNETVVRTSSDAGVFNFNALPPHIHVDGVPCRLPAEGADEIYSSFRSRRTRLTCSWRWRGQRSRLRWMHRRAGAGYRDVEHRRNNQFE